MLEFLTILNDFLQVAYNATVPFTSLSSQTATAPLVQQQVDANTSTITALAGTTIATVSGLVGKHFYDSKKRDETLTVASDVDRMLAVEMSDNYDDFSKGWENMELFIRMIMQNPDAKMSDVLNKEVDDVTKETLGQRLVEFSQTIQRYNQEYYKNTLTKPNALIYNSKNPLKNVRNLVRDMSVPTPS